MDALHERLVGPCPNGRPHIALCSPRADDLVDGRHSASKRFFCNRVYIAAPGVFIEVVTQVKHHVKVALCDIVVGVK